MSFILRNLTGAPLPIDDLGIELAAAEDYDMLHESPQDVQHSGRLGGDIYAAITNDDAIVLSPKDGVTVLSKADSITVVSIHNDPNWGINGGVLNDLDDVDTSTAAEGDVLVFGPGGLTVGTTTPAVLAADIDLGDLQNVTDGTTPTAADIFILKGTAGGEFTVVDGTGDAVLLDHIQDTAGNQLAGATQTDLTVTYNPATNAMDLSVDDNFLRNTGDTLDSGTLVVASGATIAVATGGDITAIDAPTNPNDLANKAYVDSLASGTSWKDPILDPSLVDIISANPATPEVTYSVTTGEHVVFIATGTFTAAYGTGTTVNAVAGDILTLEITSAGNGDYSLLETPLAVGHRFIIAGEHGTIGTALGLLDVNSDTFTLDDGDLIEFTGAGAGDGTTAGDWSTPDGRGGVSGGSPEIAQGVTVLCSDPQSAHYGHTYLYDASTNLWVEIAGPGSVQAGIGLSYAGSTLNFDPSELANTATLSTDYIVLGDASNAEYPIKRDVASFITEHDLVTISGGGTLTASNGVELTGTDFALSIDSLTPATIVGADLIVFDDGAAGTNASTTVTNFLADLDIVNGITANGILVRTANDVYASRTIVASAVAGDEGISVVAGDGVASNPTIGIDITGQTASLADMITTTEFLVYDGSNNIKMTGTQIADGVSTILGGLGNAYTTIQGDTGSTTAANSTDTLKFADATNGGIATLANDGVPDTVTFAMDLPDLAAGVGTVDLTDIIAVGEGANTVSYTLQEMVTDLGIPNGIGALTGIVVGDGAGNFQDVTIVASGVGAEDGLIVTNGSGVAGDPTVGLDINGNALAGEDLAATDKVIGYNVSGTANEAFTGQEVADGVATMLGFGGLSVVNIPASTGTQPVLCLEDTTRANKILSVGDTSVNWSENKVGNNSWMNIGGAVDALTGYIVPLNATIVKVTAHTSDNKNNVKPILLYVNGTLNSTVATFNGAAGEDIDEDVTLNIDVAAGDKLRIRGGTGGPIEDTVITLWLKWRG